MPLEELRTTPKKTNDFQNEHEVFNRVRRFAVKARQFVGDTIGRMAAAMACNS